MQGDDISRCGTSGYFDQVFCFFYSEVAGKERPEISIVLVSVFVLENIAGSELIIGNITSRIGYFYLIATCNLFPLR